MSTSPRLRGRIAAAAASAVAASSLLGLGPAQAAAPKPTHGTTVDYFDDVYTALGANSVFETVTVERFEYLLKNKEGNFAFFIGDPADASSQATIGHINDVAKQQGISKIYNFTPKLDGDTLNIWDLSESGLRTGVSPDPAGGNRAGQGLAQYQTLGDRLLSDYLNKDTQTEFTKDAETDPYLFVYNKDRTIGAEEDRIVAALSGVKTAADLDEPSEVSAYETQVQQVLGSVPAAEIATNTNFEFQKTETNRRHTTTPAYADASKYGGTILDDADAADGFRIQTVTYPELIHLLQQPGDIPILFGGTWCHNTRAIIKYVNADAQKHGIKTVYNFDFSLASTGNGGGDALHIRDNALPDAVGGKVIRPSHLYGDLVNTYLTNAATEYRTTSAEPGASNVSPVNYYPGGDTTKEVRLAHKIQVGHLLTYNKDRKDADGKPAPVIDQAIRQNNDGGNTEHMTEWWYTSGHQLPRGDASLSGQFNVTVPAGADELQNQRNFAREALEDIDAVLAGVGNPADHDSTTTVTGLGGAGDPVVAEGQTPTFDVAVTAAGYSPFISLNTASGASGQGQNRVVAAPSTGVAGPRGTVRVLDGATEVARARLKRDGTASITLPAQPAGSQSLVVKYDGRGDTVEPSSANLDFDVVGDPSTTTLSGPTDLTFGEGGTFTATVGVGDQTPAPTGPVELDGLPGDPIVVQLGEAGTATFELPASTPAGSHDLVATYKGDTKYGSSSTEVTKLTVKKALATLTHTVVGSSYGKSAQVRAQVTGPAGVVPTGKVDVTVAGKVQSVSLDGQGRATVVLSRTLLPKSYAVTVVYGGNGNLIARSAFGTLKIAKGTTKAPTFAAKGTIKAKKAGKATVRVATTAGLAKAGGKVKIVLKKGKTSRTVTATVRSGVASVKLPKLAKGTWSVKVTYLGDPTYLASKTVSKTLKVK